MHCDASVISDACNIVEGETCTSAILFKAIDCWDLQNILLAILLNPRAPSFGPCEFKKNKNLKNLQKMYLILNIISHGKENLIVYIPEIQHLNCRQSEH